MELLYLLFLPCQVFMNYLILDFEINECSLCLFYVENPQVQEYL